MAPGAGPSGCRGRSRKASRGRCLAPLARPPRGAMTDAAACGTARLDRHSKSASAGAVDPTAEGHGMEAARERLVRYLSDAWAVENAHAEGLEDACPALPPGEVRNLLAPRLRAALARREKLER